MKLFANWMNSRHRVRNCLGYSEVENELFTKVRPTKLVTSWYQVVKSKIGAQFCTKFSVKTLILDSQLGFSVNLGKQLGFHLQSVARWWQMVDINPFQLCVAWYWQYTFIIQACFILHWFHSPSIPNSLESHVLPGPAREPVTGVIRFLFSQTGSVRDSNTETNMYWRAGWFDTGPNWLVWLSSDWFAVKFANFVVLRWIEQLQEGYVV